MSIGTIAIVDEMGHNQRGGCVFATEDFLPFLSTACTLALFQMAGNIAVRCNK